MIETDSRIEWVDGEFRWVGDDPVAILPAHIAVILKPNWLRIGQQVTTKALTLQLVWTSANIPFVVYVGRPGVRSRLISTRCYLESTCKNLKGVILRVCEIWGLAEIDPRCYPSWKDLRWPFRRRNDA